jgi:hypothetical protein
MNHKSNRLILVAAFVGLIATTAAFAGGNTRSAENPHATQGTMGGSMGMMGGMSGDYMAQMSRMIENCNRMMENATGRPLGVDKDRVPDAHK